MRPAASRRRLFAAGGLAAVGLLPVVTPFAVFCLRAIEQARLEPKNSGKPEQVLQQIVDGKVRKVFAEQTLLTQLFVKDDKQTVEKLLKAAGAKLIAFQRFEVGAGIEKTKEDYVAEIQKQVEAARDKE